MTGWTVTEFLTIHFCVKYILPIFIPRPSSHDRIADMLIGGFMMDGIEGTIMNDLTVREFFDLYHPFIDAKLSAAAIGPNGKLRLAFVRDQSVISVGAI